MRPTNFRGVFRTDDEARAAYSEAAGIGRAMPIAVAVPRDGDDVATIMAWARSVGVPIVPRGSGSSMAGGAVGEGVVLDLSRLDSVGGITGQRTIEVGPGAIRNSIDAVAAKDRRRFPVDPSSGAFCTIGGMIATNAAGPRSLRYGSTRRWVVALDCVFDDGSRAIVRRGESPPKGIPAVDRFLAEAAGEIRAEQSIASTAHAGVHKEASGYGIAEYAAGDLVDLLVGSEGTLAIFVGAELYLTDVPRATSSLLAAFSSLEGAATAAAEARAAGASACELLDRTFLEVAGRAEANDATQAVLLAEVEGESADEARAQARTLERAFLRSGATSVRLALEPPDESALWEIRHSASPTLARLDPRLKSMQFIEDAAVPQERLPDYVMGVRRALDAHGIRGVIFGHAGDGHVHVNPLIDVSDPAWRDKVEALMDEVTALVARLGGTLTGEHGDGRIRTPLLGRVWPWPAPHLFRRVKRAFDPTGVLNPGVKVPLPHQPALEQIKYDPALVPLPEKARRALDLVERERRYADFRLDLIG